MNPLASPITKLSTLDHLEPSRSLPDDPILQPNQDPLPQIPKRIILFILLLFVTGVIFSAIGMQFYLEMSSKVIWKEFQNEGIMFLILGLFLVVPGGYYGWTVYFAWRCQDTEERREILDVFYLNILFIVSKFPYSSID